ncbi:uncharacterized protein LOC116415709 isoform X1 [Nasonia vitripennis]|uniref:Uncharacterized protein n=1 Tax=Nasonia vitripennis TaxID=7425 RepID=A0A7M7PWH1_NASVI|nr:uncharacterized protein LOC116415709 isoform X1 [Nasonia vitripennis]
MPTVYPEDWGSFCKSIDTLLHDSENVKTMENRLHICDLFFMRYVHGLKLSDSERRPNFVRFMTEDMDVDSMSGNAEVVQIHIANTIEPIDDFAVVIDYSKLGHNVFKKAKDACRYRSMFLHDYGHVTSRLCSSSALWENVTYVQAYLPEIHAYMCRLRKRWGSVTGFVVAGGYSCFLNTLPLHKNMKRLVSDAKGRMADYKTGFEVLRTSASLRIEEVRTFQGSTCLKNAQNSFENVGFLTSSAKKFFECGSVCVASNWTRYMTWRIQGDLDFLVKCYDLVNATAGNSLTRATIEECYDSELRLRYFLYGRWPNCPDARITWLLNSPREGFRGANVEEGTYVFRRQTAGEMLKLSERRQLRQPPITFKDEFFGWPFMKVAIVEMTQYYPEEETDLDKQANQTLDLKIHFLMTRLIGFSRLNHGFSDYTFRFVEHAFSRRAIQTMILKQGKDQMEKAYISGVVPVSTLVKSILNPNTKTGMLIRSTVYLPEPMDHWQNVIRNFVKKHVQVFPMALLSKKHHQRYKWYEIRDPTVKEKEEAHTLDPEYIKCLNLKQFQPKKIDRRLLNLKQNKSMVKPSVSSKASQTENTTCENVVYKQRKFNVKLFLERQSSKKRRPPTEMVEDKNEDEVSDSDKSTSSSSTTAEATSETDASIPVATAANRRIRRRVKIQSSSSSSSS